MNRQRGFTLIEILVAIAIISILIGLLFVGIRSVSASSRTKATRVTLTNAMALYTEWKVNGQPSEPSWGPMTPPGLIQEGQPGRTGPAVLWTRSAMKRLINVPANRSMVGKLPPDQLLPGVTSATAPLWTNGTVYTALDRVEFPTAGSGNYYIAAVDHTASNAVLTDNQPNSSVTKVWLKEEATQATMLDAWNNPILYAPAGGLREVILANEAPAWAAGQSYGKSSRVRQGTIDYTCVKAHGPATVGDQPPPNTAYWIPGGVKSPDGQPFFASAGPDEDFSKGDDNVYSFEN